jgi:protocatechuate 3,4-dioxygenase beta subunit
VTSADTGTPLRRAQIQLSSPQTGSRVLTTDAEGRFEFGNLAAGQYTLMATKVGYLRAQYGQRGPLGPLDSGRPIELGELQKLDGVDLQLVRGGVITGLLVDEFGEPVPDASVQALRYQFVNGQRRLVRAGRVAQTNDIGEFRIFGLFPGKYYISGIPPTAAAAPTQGVSLPVAPAANQAPRAMRAGVESLEPTPDASAGYAPTYYPGTPSVADAHLVTIGAGDEVHGVRFPLVAARLFRIAGTIRDSRGSPVDLPAIELLPVSGAPVPMRARARATPLGQGAFTLDDVPPGEYVLQVRTMNRAAGVPESADLQVMVDGNDVDNLVVTTSPGAIVSGRILVKSGRAANLSSAIVSALRLEASTTVAGMAKPAAQVRADGSFEVRNVSGVVFRIAPTPPGLSLSAVRFEGVDITDRPYRFKGGGVSGLEIELTDELTHVSGTVSDERGEPARDYAVVVFADDVERWGPYTRFVRAAHADAAGEFAVEGLPPGRYLAAAVDHLQRGAEADPDLLEQLKARATSITLRAGEKQRLTLKRQR